MAKKFTKTLAVTQDGNPINKTNPLEVNLGTTSIEINISSLSVQLEVIKVGSVDDTDSGAHMLAINATREAIVYNTASVTSALANTTTSNSVGSLDTKATARNNSLGFIKADTEAIKITSNTLAGAVSGAQVSVKYKADVLNTNSSVAVSTVSTLILATNSARTNAIITNVSTGSILNLSVGADALVDKGITLYPKGSFEINALNHTTRAIKGVNNSTSTKVVTVVEY